MFSLIFFDQPNQTGVNWDRGWASDAADDFFFKFLLFHPCSLKSGMTARALCLQPSSWFTTQNNFLTLFPFLPFNSKISAHILCLCVQLSVYVKPSFSPQMLSPSPGPLGFFQFRGEPAVSGTCFVFPGVCLWRYSSRSHYTLQLAH